MKARKHLLTHVFISLAALPLAVPAAYAAALPQGGQPLHVNAAADAPADFRVAQATEPPPADENDPEWLKKHKKGGEKPPAEAQKPEPPKQEAPKVEPPKAEPPKPEPPKPEPPKPEPPKAEAPTQQSSPPKAELQKLEPPKAEPPKMEPPKAAAPKVEDVKPEAPKPAVPANGAPQPEAKQPLEPKAQPKPPVEKPAPEAVKPAEQAPQQMKPAEKPAAEAVKPTVEPKSTEKPAVQAPPPKSTATPDEPKPDTAEVEAPKASEQTPGALKAPSGAKPSGETKPATDAVSSEKLAPEAPTPAPTAGAPADQKAPVLDSAKQAPAPDSAKEAPAPVRSKIPVSTEAPANQPSAVAPPPPAGQRRLAPASGERRAPPKSDADAQGAAANVAPPPPIAPAGEPEGRRLDQRPTFDAPRDAQVEGRIDGRDILNILGQMIVRGGDANRFSRGGARTFYDELPGGRTRETIERPEGVSVITIRNRYGDVIQRSRIGRNGRETVLFYAPELERRPDREQVFRDPSLDLPPMQLDIPVDDYIIDTSNVRNPDYYDFLREPPVEHVERVYSLDEVRYSARVRDKMRRVDLDTIHFATGSADVSLNEASSLKRVAEAMKRIIDRNPAETFLIEGHTDAVGSDQANLVLSDRRAESVAIALTDLFGIPPENLVTQGYGERFLKVRTDGPSQENRRVTIRRITPLVRPVAARQ